MFKRIRLFILISVLLTATAAWAVTTGDRMTFEGPVTVSGDLTTSGSVTNSGTVQSRLTTVITVNQTAQIKVGAKSTFPGTIGIVFGNIPWPDGNPAELVFASIHIEKLA